MEKKRIVKLVILILWIAVIWGHSMKDAVASTNESNFFIEMLASMGIYVTEFFIRKMAHLTEYAIVGILLSINIKEYKAKLDYVIYTMFSGLIIATMDETIQMFSIGRSCEVKDVWIDFAGVVLGTVIIQLFQNVIKKGNS